MIPEGISKVRSVIVSACCLAMSLAVPVAAQDKPPDQPAAGAQNSEAAPKAEPVPEARPAAETATAERKPFDLRSTPYLTGDWGGVRTRLEDKGVKVTLKLMNEFMVNMHGGQETKNGHDAAGSYDLDLNLDFEKMGLLKGASFFIRGKGTWGGDDSDFDKEKIGGLFKTNADAGPEEVILIDKYWWKQLLLEKKIELRLGRLEATKDLFDTSTIMGDEDKYFLNQALVRNQNIAPGKGLGVYAKWRVTDAWYVQAAAINAQSTTVENDFHTAFHEQAWYRGYGEVGFDPQWSTARGKLPGHYRAGVWFDPTVKQRYYNTLGGALANRYDSNDWGGYFGFDQMIWKENDDPKDQQGMSIAGRYGWADGEVNRIENFWAAAVQYLGLIPTRDKDMIGVGVAEGILSDEYDRVHPGADDETVFELYYSYEFAPWLHISPTFQFIHQAGGDANDPDTTVGGIRIRMDL